MRKIFICLLGIIIWGCSNHPETTGLLTYYDKKGKLKTVKTASDWENKRGQILDSLQAAMGKVPSFDNLPPLNVQYIDSLKEQQYTRYTITFDAAEKESVPAYLYIPVSPESQKHPAILALHPTGVLGKRIVDGEGTSGRAYAKELAQRGYVVIAPDYPGFGDLEDYDFSNDRYESGTMKGIFNHMRCVDLLQSLPLVEPDKIAVIGHSLGGHNAMFVAAFDPRLKVVISSCGWTEFEYYDIGPSAEELYGGRLGPFAQDKYMPLFHDKYHLDGDKIPFNFHEIIALLAPRLFYSNSPIDDTNFDVEGVKVGMSKALPVYQLFDASSQIYVKYPGGGHNFQDSIRMDAYQLISDTFR